MNRFACILADPPWPQVISGKYKTTRNLRPDRLPYETLSVAAIQSMPVEDIAAHDAHLWLWTTNQFLEDGFRVMRSWGFKYLAPIHAIKPSGIGNYFIHRTQTMLFGYRGKCRFPMARYIEAISPGPRIELFARRQRPGWHVWGNEVKSSIELTAGVPS